MIHGQPPPPRLQNPAAQILFSRAANLAEDGPESLTTNGTLHVGKSLTVTGSVNALGRNLVLALDTCCLHFGGFYVHGRLSCAPRDSPPRAVASQNSGVVFTAASALSANDVVSLTPSAQVTKGFGMQVTALSSSFDVMTSPVMPLAVNMTSTLVVVFSTPVSGVGQATLYDTTTVIPKVSLTHSSLPIPCLSSSVQLACSIEWMPCGTPYVRHPFKSSLGPRCETSPPLGFPTHCW